MFWVSWYVTQSPTMFTSRTNGSLFSTAALDRLNVDVAALRIDHDLLPAVRFALAVR